VMRGNQRQDDDSPFAIPSRLPLFCLSIYLCASNTPIFVRAESLPVHCVCTECSSTRSATHLRFTTPSETVKRKIMQCLCSTYSLLMANAPPIRYAFNAYSMPIASCSVRHCPHHCIHYCTHYCTHHCTDIWARGCHCC
jgi:hypothetical protein